MQKRTSYPLHHAIVHGASLELIQALYDASPPAINERCYCYGEFLLPLVAALKYNRKADVVSFLVNKAEFHVFLEVDTTDKDMPEEVEDTKFPVHLEADKEQPDMNVLILLLDVWPQSINNNRYGYNGEWILRPNEILIKLLMYYERDENKSLPYLFEKVSNQPRTLDTMYRAVVGRIAVGKIDVFLQPLIDPSAAQDESNMGRK